MYYNLKKQKQKQDSKYANEPGNRIEHDGGGLPWHPQQRGFAVNDNNIPDEQESNACARDSITENMVGSKPTDHRPIVYTLPKNTTLENQHKLESVVDIAAMQIKFAKDACGLMGIPYEMISGGFDELRSGEKRRSQSNNKIFITNMMSVCR